MNEYISCNKCKLQLAVSQFGKATGTARGYQYSCKSCMAEYHHLNKDRIRKKKQAYYQQNRERIIAKSVQWQKDNPEAVARKNAAWIDKHPEKRLERTQRRRAKLRENSVHLITEKDMQKLYSSKCVYCGSNEKISADHVIPIFRGGQHSIGNLVPACQRCNSSKGTKTIMEWKKGATRK